MHKRCKRWQSLLTSAMQHSCTYWIQNIVSQVFCSASTKYRNKSSKTTTTPFLSFSITGCHNIPWHNQIVLVMTADHLPARGRQPNCSQYTSLNIALLHSLFLNSWRWISNQAPFITKKALKHLIARTPIGDSG